MPPFSSEESRSRTCLLLTTLSLIFTDPNYRYLERFILSRGDVYLSLVNNFMTTQMI